MRNKVVVRYLDGRLSKGVTFDFVPHRDSFHLCDVDDERKITKVETKDLKAVFFVRSFSGDPSYNAQAPSGDLQKSPGRKLRVVFKDGEVIHGNSNAYTPDRHGFFLVPADSRDNNERIFVFTRAVERIDVAKPAIAM